MNPENRSGSIYRRNDGRWVAAIDLGAPNGDRLRWTVYGKTKKEANQELDRLKQELRNGASLEASRLTLRDFLQRWLEEVVLPTVKPYTYRGTESIVRLHIVPYIGRLKLSVLTPMVVQTYYGRLEKAGASAYIRSNTHATLRWALSYAVRWGLINTNPCTSAIEPKRKLRYERNVLSPAEAKRFLKAAKGDRLYPLYVLAIVTGMRMGELFALQWQDVDWASGSIVVRRNQIEVAGRISYGTPKSKSGLRRIQLPLFALKVLEAHRSQITKPADFVFRAEEGGFIYASNFRLKCFYPLLKKAKVKRIRFHDLRHSAASLLIAEGVHPKIVAERLGHAKASLTMDIYTHALASKEREAARQLDRFFKGLVDVPIKAVEPSIA